MQTPHTLTQSADAEIAYSVGSDCTNLSTQESMPDYSSSQSAHSHFCIRYSGPVVIDSADTDIYVAAAAISQKLPGLLCIRESRRQSYATA